MQRSGSALTKLIYLAPDQKSKHHAPVLPQTAIWEPIWEFQNCRERPAFELSHFTFQGKTQSSKIIFLSTSREMGSWKVSGRGWSWTNSTFGSWATVSIKIKPVVHWASFFLKIFVKIILIVWYSEFWFPSGFKWALIDILNHKSLLTNFLRFLRILNVKKVLSDEVLVSMSIFKKNIL